MFLPDVPLSYALYPRPRLEIPASNDCERANPIKMHTTVLSLERKRRLEVKQKKGGGEERIEKGRKKGMKTQ